MSAEWAGVIITAAIGLGGGVGAYIRLALKINTLESKVDELNEVREKLWGITDLLLRKEMGEK